MKNQIIIGLGYRRHAGKDTVGAHLIKHYGFTRVAFADKLKEVVGFILSTNATDPEFKSNICDLGVTGGSALQKIGVALRDEFPEIWIVASNLEYLALYNERIVVTDVRFENEAAAVKNLGGILVQIQRPGCSSDNHISECEGDKIKWDHIIVNDGSLDALAQKVDGLMGQLL